MGAIEQKSGVIMGAREEFEPELFRNSHEALMFAFRFSTQQYALSPMAKLMKTGISSGKGLVANDGAAQAGLIMARVARMTSLHQACIIARFDPQMEECPCCQSKDKMTDAYREAIATLTEWSLSAMTGISIRNMRAAIIRSFFERGISVGESAKELGVSKSTAYDQKTKIFHALRKLDAEAQRQAEDVLVGICEEIKEMACAGKKSPV